MSDEKLKPMLSEKEEKFKFTQAIPQDYENDGIPLTEYLFDRLKEFLLKNNLPIDFGSSETTP